MQAEPAPETAEHPVAEPDPRDVAEDGWLEDEPEPEPPAEPREREAVVLGQPTVEYTAPAQPGEGDDVLEETPDFLQETPEHDRLWFEQKPPRDFDLDR